MITYFDGGTTSRYDILKRWMKGHKALFSSKREWALKVIPLTLILGALCSVLMFVLVFPQENDKDNLDRVILLLQCSLIPFVFILITFIPFSYYESFVQPNHYKRKMEGFLHRFLPDAEVTATHLPTYYTFDYKQETFDIFYNTVRRDSQLFEKGEMCIRMWFVVSEDNPYFDSEGRMTEEFATDLQAFGADKPVCKGLSIMSQRLILKLDMKETEKSGRDIEKALDMMLYLAERFKLTPVPPFNTPLIYSRLHKWIDRMLQTCLSEEAKSLSFIVYKGQIGYIAELVATPHFQSDSYDWIGRDAIARGNRPLCFAGSGGDTEVLQQLVGGIIPFLADKYNNGQLNNILGFGIDYINENLAVAFSKDEIIGAAKN